MQYLKEANKVRPLCHFMTQEARSVASHAPKLVLSHVKRDLNAVANELAQMAKRLNHSAVWRHRFPVCIEHLIAQDCNISMIY